MVTNSSISVYDNSQKSLPLLVERYELRADVNMDDQQQNTQNRGELWGQR